MNLRLCLPVAILAALIVRPSLAQEPTAPTPCRIAVILPERIDRTWFWFYYTDEAQHVVQTAVEKALTDAGLDVVDVGAADAFNDQMTVEQVTAAGTAAKKAAKLGATHVIVGKATADNAGTSQAYGVNVVRYAAEISAKLVRVSDAKVLAVESAGANSGGQGQMAAGREALKLAGADIAAKLTAAAAAACGAPAKP